MSVQRVMGIETEYGISHPGHPHANPMRLSAMIVNAYAASVPAGSRLTRGWDYDEETPLRDARGFDLSRSQADPAQLTDDDLFAANLVLTSGARLYVDHAHPEYSAPEATNPWDAMLWDRAGMLVMARAASLAGAMPGGHPLRLFKNNTDGKGASYGTHENYLMLRRTPFQDIVRFLTPFLVTRQVFTGVGRVGLGADGRGAGYQLSSRADFFEAEVGLETTVKRPIINTRDEPHADPERYRRLHVIVGDANLSETATLLKLGTTALVLGLIERGGLQAPQLRDPVAALHRVSHDTSLSATLDCLDGRRVRALDVQRSYLEQARSWVAEGPAHAEPMTRRVLALWEETLDTLELDPMAAGRTLDWVAKLRLLEGYRQRDLLHWSAPRLALVDLQYSDVRADLGLAQRLEARGDLVRLTTDDDVERAVDQPPPDTRAWFRGECVRRFPGEVAAASWDSVVFDVPGRDSLVRVPTPDPLRGSREHVSDLLEQCDSAADLLAALGRR